MRRYLHAVLLLILIIVGGTGPSTAQDIDNGRRIAERWCSQCHMIGPAGKALKGVPSFASIAAKKDISADMIASFLRLPHATMPNFPLTANDVRDIAGFILETKIGDGVSRQ